MKQESPERARVWEEQKGFAVQEEEEEEEEDSSTTVSVSPLPYIMAVSHALNASS